MPMQQTRRNFLSVIGVLATVGFTGVSVATQTDQNREKQRETETYPRALPLDISDAPRGLEASVAILLTGDGPKPTLTLTNTDSDKVAFDGVVEFLDDEGAVLFTESVSASLDPMAFARWEFNCQYPDALAAFRFRAHYAQ